MEIRGALDTIFLSQDRGVSFIPDSITVHVTETNSYSEFQKPKRFDPITGKGVSDHFRCSKINF